MISEEKILANQKQEHINREKNLLSSLDHPNVIKIYKTFFH